MKEKQIKSKTRVKCFAEVYTKHREVCAMLDLIPNFTVTQTYLEPSCGNGAFLVEIIRRKLTLCKTEEDVVSAYKSVFGIDIQQDNVEESRQNMLSELPNRWRDIFILDEIQEILKQNIVKGDFLKPDTVWFLKDEICNTP